MKLISCYIENFGNIRQRDFKFDGSLTAYCERNGYGKTTLAAFLKAMFYGLKQTRATDRELGERARFYPFEGGKFGGNVTVEKDGVVYKIERFFGKKSSTEDTVAVYADEELIGCEDLGKEFFGLDEQSFLRTVFLNSDDTECGATGDISRMLNGFIDDDDFDKAKKILERQQREYKAARGRGGKIDEKHEEVMRLKESIENKEKINGELSRKYEERKALAREVTELEERGATSRNSNLVLQKWNTLDGFLSDAETEREKLNGIMERYPAGLPSAEEIEELKRRAEELTLENERHVFSSFSAEKAKRLEELSARFSSGVPTDEEISSANETASEIIRLDAEISNLENQIRASADSRFAVKVPDEDDVKRYGEKIAILREKRSVRSNRGTVGKVLSIVFAVFALLCFAGGAFMLVKAMTLYGVILLGAGGALVIIALFAYFKGQISVIRALSSRATDELENEIKSYLARYGYYSDGGVEVDYNNLLRDLAEYKSGKEERERKEALLAERKAEEESVKNRVLSFLKKYSLYGENVQADLSRLWALVAEYVALNREKEESLARSEASREEIERHTKIAEEILEKYAIEREGALGEICAGIARDREEADRLEENIERLERRASDFKEGNGLDERPAQAEDVHGIDAQLSKKRDELSRLDMEISEDESSVERLEELKSELESALEEEENLKKKYNLLVITLTLLERAEQNLKDRYVAPVKNSFLNYSNLLERVLGERVSFDKDFKVRFERGGENRTDAHLSAGQKSLCALCLRLALIDNMYKGDKPFVIMDDPFVHLDGEHLVRAKELLKGLAADRQIIYFCCHESRKI